MCEVRVEAEEKIDDYDDIYTYITIGIIQEIRYIIVQKMSNVVECKCIAKKRRKLKDCGLSKMR
jgi:hypothetical protein